MRIAAVVFAAPRIAGQGEAGFHLQRAAAEAVQQVPGGDLAPPSAQLARQLAARLVRHRDLTAHQPLPCHCCCGGRMPIAPFAPIMFGGRTVPGMPLPPAPAQA
mmetsp:Transcript_6435/g.13715  ORF Transcript_6435/g.13715 Transcript_6435/m.13715 type:complete len:104 (+) Transcript_6435:118-429(+)